MLTDALVLVFLLAFIFWGTKRGAMRMLLSSLSLVVSILTGALLYRPVSALLSGLGLESSLTAKLEENLDKIADLPDVMQGFISVTEAEDKLAEAVASAAVGVLSFLIIMVAVRVLLTALGIAMGLAGSMPVLRQANGLLGGIGGFAEGAVILLVIFGALAVYEAFGQPGLTDGLFGGSHIALWVYDHNPLLSLVMGAAETLKG